MRHIEGRCHCGNIAYSFLWPGDEVIPARACGCSFCTKHGGVYTSHPHGRLDARIKDPALVHQYTFGTKTAEFYVCRLCGVVPFVTSTVEDSLYAVVNVHTFEGVDAEEIDVAPSHFDAEGVGERLERRRRHWIPNVNLQHSQDV